MFDARERFLCAFGIFTAQKQKKKKPDNSRDLSTLDSGSENRFTSRRARASCTRAHTTPHPSEKRKKQVSGLPLIAPGPFYHPPSGDCECVSVHWASFPGHLLPPAPGRVERTKQNWRKISKQEDDFSALGERNGLAALR